MFHYIFNKSLQAQYVPIVWEDAVLVPVPKTGYPKGLNDFRLFALTSVVMKVFEKPLKSKGACARPHRGAEDASVTFLNLTDHNWMSAGSLFARQLN